MPTPQEIALLAHRYQWADLCLSSLICALSESAVRRSLLCSGQGTDSDFTGGAAGWELAAHCLEEAASKKGLTARLQPQSVCATLLQ